jgi:hypothetical protein
MRLYSFAVTVSHCLVRAANCSREVLLISALLIEHFARLYRVDLRVIERAAFVAHQLLLTADGKVHNQCESVKQATVCDAGSLILRRCCIASRDARPRR